MGWLVTDLALDEFEDFCSKLNLENGSAMELEPFQREFLAPYFSGATETAVILPKGNGKTSILAALGLYHLINTDNADAIIAAAARDQARKMFEYASGFVRRSPWLEDHVRVQEGYLWIRSRNDAGVVKVISAEPRTVDGQGNTLCLCDELHRWKSAELYGLLRDGLPKRQGQMVSISTAGDSEASPLGRLRQKALKLPHVTRQGVHIVAHDDEEAFYLHEWSLTDDDDYEDFELVKEANPLSIHSVESLRKRYHSTSMEPWQWLRFACNVWIGGENAAIDPVAWRSCGKGTGLIEGESCWLGMDVGWRTDSTALVPFTFDPEEDLEVVGRATIIDAPNDGTSTHPDHIVSAIKAIHARNPIQRLVFDPRAEGEILAFRIQDELGIAIEPHSQEPTPMSDAAMGLAEAIRADKLIHPEDESLTAHVLAAGAKAVYGTDRWRFVKQTHGRKIDAAIALAIVRAKRMAKPARGTLAPEDYTAIAA